MDKSTTSKTKLATFAGGCFWCMVSPFDQKEGIVSVISGYTGGITENPTYQEVCSALTGHYEAVQITFDPNCISYDQILNIYWKQIDPTDVGGQFADRGQSYETAIFYHDEEQRQIIESSKMALMESGQFELPIVTKILPASTFYPAEEYHQDYHQKNPAHYQQYRQGSGRAAYIDKQGQESLDSLKSRLSSIQYHVTQENGTEPPFQNEYWDKKEEGLYVDLISGEPLFHSKDKFDSGCGWPSFAKPLNSSVLKENNDHSQGMNRIEVRSNKSESHLGHVFTDGPGPEGLRYCINSAAVRFLPKEELERQGYGNYLYLFE